MATQTPILKKSRIHDAITLTMRDIIMKDILTETEIGHYCNENHDFDKLNIYIDYFEFSKNILFNLSINDEPAIDKANEFEMYLVTGNGNDTGREPYKICGEIRTKLPDTLVDFKMPVEGVDVPKIFSEHKEGYSYVNYVIFGVIKNQEIVPEKEQDARERIMICKGKIYRTNILYDLTENVLDGQ